MERRTLDNGRWFDAKKAESFAESNGFEWIDVTLYKTASGAWVLETDRSRYMEGRVTLRVIDASEAAKWLLANGHFDAVPNAARAEIEI